VAIEEVPGGSKALQALLGGSVDVAASFFENAIELASEGREVQSFMLLQERPGFVLVASPASRRKIAT
jgi:NitT/TauT family transport system substrate-binding protein